MPIVVLQDNKEKKPWDFTIYSDIKEQRITHLDTGDYSLLGFEKEFCLERKRSTGELALNLGQKSTAFLKEFERMSTFKKKVIICEFPESYMFEFPKNSGIPQKYWRRLRMTGKFMLKRLNDWSDCYGVELIFANDRDIAESKAIDLIREFATWQ